KTSHCASKKTGARSELPCSLRCGGHRPSSLAGEPGPLTVGLPALARDRHGGGMAAASTPSTAYRLLGARELELRSRLLLHALAQRSLDPLVQRPDVFVHFGPKHRLARFDLRDDLGAVNDDLFSGRCLVTEHTQQKSRSSRTGGQYPREHGLSFT